MRHPTEVAKVAFSPDNRLALTIGGDGSARLWDIGTGKLLARPMQYEIGLNVANLKIDQGAFNADGSPFGLTIAKRFRPIHRVQRL